MLKMRILWIEDDYYFIKGLVEPLIEMGFVVQPSRSFIDAIEKLKKWNEYDLIMLDLIIPYSEDGSKNPLESSNDVSGPKKRLLGLDILRFLTNDLKINIPIIILSIVMTSDMLDKVSGHDNITYIRKVGQLPSDIKKLVVDVLKIE